VAVQRAFVISTVSNHTQALHIHSSISVLAVRFDRKHFEIKSFLPSGLTENDDILK